MEQMSEHGTVPETPAAAPEPTNPFARIAGVLFSPGETFASIARKPDWLIPLLVILGLSLGSFYLIAPKLDYEPQMREMFEKNPNVPEQRKEQMIEESLERVETMKKFGFATSLLSVLVITGFISGVFWGGLRAFGADNTFKQTFSVVVYSWMPQVIKGILVTAIAFPRSSIDVRFLGGLLKSNLGAFVDPTESAALYSLLSSVDLSNIWVLVLLSIGLTAISKFSRSKVATSVVVLFLIYVGIKVGIAALLGGMG